MKNAPEFTSRMSRGETAAALAYLPIHAAVLPVGLTLLLIGRRDAADINFIVYLIGVVYMLIFEWKFLRREFYSLCDRPLDCFVQILICYGLMLGLNLCINSLMLLLNFDSNPNNSAVVDLAELKMGPTAAMAIFLAPIVEELVFRGGVFGLLRRYNRLLAYVVSILVFGLYHIWSSAIENPLDLIYIIQYIPASYALCRCYERTNSIWAGIFLHMLNNGVALKALDFLGGMG